jgi:hypothetical protein
LIYEPLPVGRGFLLMRVEEFVSHGYRRLHRSFIALKCDLPISSLLLSLKIFLRRKKSNAILYAHADLADEADFFSLNTD